MAKQYPCVDCMGDDEILMQKTQCGPDLEVDRCPRCGGIWLDNGELETLAALGPFYTENLETPVASRAERNPDRHCPKCKKPLEIMRYDKMPEIEFDVCPKCGGLWCDAGELKAVCSKYHS
jgi:Zn-finger nucleic acid-binding protein